MRIERWNFRGSDMSLITRFEAGISSFLRWAKSTWEREKKADSELEKRPEPIIPIAKARM
jgi:hypothetical protein